MKRYLLIFLLAFSFWACSDLKHLSSAERQFDLPCPVIAMNDNLRLIYKASIDVFDNHFSGLFVFRKPEGHQDGYVSFLSEVGFEFFRFKYANNNITLEASIESMNKPVIINTFIQFLENVLYDPQIVEAKNITFFNTFENEKAFLIDTEEHKLLYYLNKDMRISKIDRLKRKKKTGELSVVYDMDEKSKSMIAESIFPESISYKNNRIKLNIDLTRF